MSRRDLLVRSALFLAGCSRKPEAPVTPPHPDRIRVEESAPAGRVLVMDSLTYCDDTVGPGDVVVGASFAGAVSVALALARRAKAVVAHAAGVGKDEAGVSGLPLADAHGVPAAAVETMSARLADGRSLYAGVIGRANAAARRLGVAPGQPVADAAGLLLAAPPGRAVRVEGLADETPVEVDRTASGGVFAVWSLLRVNEARPADVFCVASHAGTVMADYARPVRPRGVIANDAGRGKDDSGVAGLPLLAEAGVAAAAVGAMSARIGDARSTHADGIVSAANAVALARGVRVGMPARDAARLLSARGT